MKFIRRFLAVLMWLLVLPIWLSLTYLVFQVNIPPLSDTVIVAAFQVAVIGTAIVMSVFLIAFGPVILMGGLAQLLWGDD